MLTSNELNLIYRVHIGSMLTELPVELTYRYCLTNDLRLLSGPLQVGKNVEWNLLSYFFTAVRKIFVKS